MSQFYVSVLPIVFGVALSAAAPWRPAPGNIEVALWPGAAPDAPRGADGAAETVSAVNKAKELVAARPWTEVENVSRPTLTGYAPKGPNTGAAVMVFPGGGYKILAIDLEGTEVCDWLTAKGITCVLLKYRVPDSGPHWEASCYCQVFPPAPLALEDAQRALGLVRRHAAEWHIDPHKVGVLGFSAGGHLSAAMSTHTQRLYHAIDAADRESCRPDFAVVLYPGHLAMGKDGGTLNPDIRPARATPPIFLLQAENDPVDDVRNSLVFYAALKRAGAPVELHLYAEGGHAFGLRPTKFPITGWPALVEKWLVTIGMISTAPVVR